MSALETTATARVDAACAKRVLLLACAGILVAFSTLALLDTSGNVHTPPLTPSERVPATRLVVVLIDSLARRDVETRSFMPELQKRLARASLHGPVRACADAITVPCMLATITGSDRQSVFSLGANFGGKSGAVENSVLGQLERAGHPVGYFGEHILKRTLTGISRIVANLRTDQDVLRATQRALDEGKLHVLIAHLRALDETAHEKRATSTEFARVRTSTDKLVASFLPHLHPSDHALIMGDHGHTDDGRHGAGLSSDTYAGYFGARFRRALSEPIAITEHAAIWASVFGFDRARPAWLSAYLANGKVVPRTDLPPLPPEPPPSGWALSLAALVAALALAWIAGKNRANFTIRVLVSLGVSLILMMVLGMVWPDLRAWFWKSTPRMVVSTLLAMALSAALGRGLATRILPARTEPATGSEAALCGALLFAIPTCYWQGGPSVVVGLLLVFSLVLVMRHGRLGERANMARSFAAFLCLVGLSLVQLANYEFRGFLLLNKLVRTLPVSLGVTLLAGVWFAALFAAHALEPRKPRTWLAPLFGLALCIAVGHVPAIFFAPVMVLCFIATLGALHDARLASVSIAMLMPSLWFAFEGNVARLLAVCATFMIWACLARATERDAPATRGTVLAALVLLSFWASMGGRISGIDFNFFFGFLSKQDSVTEHWLLQAALTTLKYLLVPSFGAVFAPALRSSQETVAWSAHVMFARVALTVVFVGTLKTLHPNAGTLLVGDAVQEVAFWALCLLTLMLLVRPSPRVNSPFARSSALR